VSDESGLRIDPARVKLSSGGLPLPEQIKASFTDGGDLQFTWNPGQKDLPGSFDQIMMLAYDVKKGVVHLNTTGQFRSTGSDTLNLSKSPDGDFHVYAAFSAADRSSQSESVYLGEWKK
jgi:hypothetical protein